MTAGTVFVGNASTGEITVSAAITHANNLTLTTGAGISASEALTLAADKNLSAMATGTVSLSGANADWSTSGMGTLTLVSTRDVLVLLEECDQRGRGRCGLRPNQQATPSTGGFKGVEINSASVAVTGSGALTVLGRGGSGPGKRIWRRSQFRRADFRRSGACDRARYRGGVNEQFQFRDQSWLRHLDHIERREHCSRGSGRRGRGFDLWNEPRAPDFGNGLRRGMGTVEISAFGGLGTTTNNSTGIFMSGGAIQSAGGDVIVSGTGGGEGAGAAGSGFLMSGGSIPLGRAEMSRSRAPVSQPVR